MAISPQNNERKELFYTGKLYGLTGMSYLHTERVEDAHIGGCVEDLVEVGFSVDQFQLIEPLLVLHTTQASLLMSQG